GAVAEASGLSAFTGLSAEQFSGRSWLDVVLPDDCTRIERQWKDATTGDAPFDLVCMMRRTDDAYRRLSITAAPVRTARGRVREWVCAASDITERRQLSEASMSRPRWHVPLGEHEKSLLESVSDGLLTVDRRGIITYVNAQVEDVLGMRRDELV